MNGPERKAAMARIDLLDRLFERATCWGSWMVDAANEREALIRI